MFQEMAGVISDSLQGVAYPREIDSPRYLALGGHVLADSIVPLQGDSNNTKSANWETDSPGSDNPWKFCNSKVSDTREIDSPLNF